MKNLLKIVALLLAVVLAQPVQAQFRSEKRTADKEFELQAYNLAIESYKKALARRPDDLESLSRIADSYRMLNQMQTAHQYYQQAMRDRRVSKETILAHAKTLKALGRYDEAKQFFLLYARDYDQVVGNHYAQSCDFAMRQQNADAGFVVQSTTINSPVADFGPTLPQPTQLVFNSARATAGFQGQSVNQPYVAAVGQDGNPLQAYPLTTGYTTEAGNVGPVSYSPDGTQVIFSRNNFTAGTRMVPEAGISLNLLIADVNQQGMWINARPLPFNGTDYNTGFGTFSNDGNAIYFSSDRPEGYGGFDIYRATRQGQTWEAVPENLGTVVNSVGNEITPFYDGASLFFSSDWHHGLGTYDVFRSEMAAGRPTTLYHMGSSINSTRDDYGFIYDPTTNSGYVVSNRIGGSGQEDVYRVGRANSNMILLVSSSMDGSVIPNAAIDFTGCGGQVYATDVNGRYVFQSTEGLNCNIVIGANGFQSVSIPLQNMQPDANNIVRVSLNQDANGGSGMAGSPGSGAPLGVNPNAPVPPGSVRGFVTNAQDGYPVMDAAVVITKRTTGQSASIRTNQDGAYFVAVEPFTTYDVAIEAYGFEPINFPVQIDDGSNINAFGNVTMLPSQGGYNPSNPPVNPGTIGQTIQGYSVQIASVSKEPDMSTFSNMTNIGRVYSVNTGGAYKLRIGVFATRAEAEEAAATAKSIAYPGAFIVEDTGPAAGGAGAYPNNPSMGGGNTPTTPTNPTAPTANSAFKVQIGAYGNPANFDRSKASQLGLIESKTRDNLTIFMIGGLQTQAQAESVKAQAQSLGYSGAFILQNVNGTMQRL